MVSSSGVVVVVRVVLEYVFLAPVGDCDSVREHFNLTNLLLNVVGVEEDVLNVCCSVTLMEDRLLVEVDSIHQPQTEEFVLLETPVEV